MTRAKKTLATIALMLGVTAAAASPALADNGMPVAPPDNGMPVAPLDNGMPVAPPDNPMP
ncbi:hypothetical protein QFZ24_004444 [Streptomyces phaeochromogenes]|jgi:hypothetical protein|uniref:hypothetical protein n=1 Tax=Streptomyces phaeochromogenes TaxID=1923 RepID=UPI00278D24C9|nr:hypothetical protein [Streptomyces phaeochromogenes]MDQ0950521.1 hypothetical protein [Streptomyces phaeochromogenes]